MHHRVSSGTQRTHRKWHMGTAKLETAWFGEGGSVATIPPLVSAKDADLRSALQQVVGIRSSVCGPSAVLV
jgi:hypothetical protein